MRLFRRKQKDGHLMTHEERKALAEEYYLVVERGMEAIKSWITRQPRNSIPPEVLWPPLYSRFLGMRDSIVMAVGEGRVRIIEQSILKGLEMARGQNLADIPAYQDADKPDYIR